MTAQKLIIDIGNSLKKAALFDGKSLTDHYTFDQESWEEFETFLLKFTNVNACILSSVVELPQGFCAELQRKFTTFIELKPGTPVPITNLYHAPETLGNDRLAAACGGESLFPGCNTLVITAGSCVIYDFTDHQKNYLGGSISPGLKMRFKALHNYTNKLPLVQERNFDRLTGRNTEESLLSGVIKGMVYEMKSFINDYQAKYPGLQVIISGGDLNFFEMPLKSGTFAVPNIVLIGLNEILDHNAKE
jgi:type III pantothenate kinase